MARTRSLPSAEGLVTGLRCRTLVKGLPGTAGAVSNARPLQQPVCRLQQSTGGDMAGGPARTITLSSPGWLPRFCVCLPAILLWTGLLVVILAALFSTPAFYAVTAILSIFTMSYSAELSISSLVGACRMRRAAKKDWHAMLTALLEEKPEYSDVTHIVILPNYKEDEEMLFRTLENIAESPLAQESIRVVLAMEEREGPSGVEKAERLIKRLGHRFADVFATFHPANLPGDLAGKSSNSQWAYRQMLSRYSGELQKMDISRVLLSIGDADTLWNPQYFSALSYEALSMPVEQRVWAFWQSPMLLVRNLQSAPAMTRVSGYVAVLFELAGLTNQYWAPALCFSSYSLTLALANHSLVGGWDRDVIAEDHHMFCKCFFAAIRAGNADAADQLGSPKVQVQPIYLPSTAFLVESDGYVSSLHARFQQACRHSQGVVELSYTVYQYCLLLEEFGASKIPLAAHTRTWGIIYKMVAVHMVNQVEGLAVIMAGLIALPNILRWVFAGGLAEMLRICTSQGMFAALGRQSFGGISKWAVYSICGPLTPVILMMVCTCYLVIKDLYEGKLTRHSQKHLAGETQGDKIALSTSVVAKAAAEPDVQGYVGSSLSLFTRLRIFLVILADYFGTAQFVLFLYGIFPVILSTTGLLLNGTKCEYIVAAKPK